MTPLESSVLEFFKRYKRRYGAALFPTGYVAEQLEEEEIRIIAACERLKRLNVLKRSYYEDPARLYYRYD